MVSLSEQQRQAYLAAMGIQPYFPKLVLPGAKASPSYERSPLSIDSAVDPLNPETVIVEPESKPGKRQKIDLSVKPAEPRPIAGKTTTQINHLPREAGQVDATTDSTLRFRLRYFSINPILSVVDEVPYLQSGADSGQSLRLLQFILRALEVTPALDAYEAESFNWPLTEISPVQGSEPNLARQAVNGFIRRRFELHGFKYLLVFSNQLDQVISPASLPATGAQFTYPDLGFHVTLSKSLHAMLSVPALKRTVWQDLQPVREKLAASTGGQS